MADNTTTNSDGLSGAQRIVIRMTLVSWPNDTRLFKKPISRTPVEEDSILYGYTDEIISFKEAARLQQNDN